MSMASRDLWIGSLLRYLDDHPSHQSYDYYPTLIKNNIRRPGKTVELAVDHSCYFIN